jgi:hypothetical protein
MSVLTERVLRALKPHLDGATIATLTDLSAATPVALTAAVDVLLTTASVAEAEATDTAPALVSLCASAVGDVNAELAARPPARPSLGNAGARVPNKPRASRRTGTGTVITASGAAITDDESLAEAFNNAVRMARRSDSPQVIARQRWSYPEERSLSSADSITNAHKLDAVASQDALVASGGVCNPVAVDWSIPLWSSADRPLRDGLPNFGAKRGGLRFMATPTLASVGAAGTTVWTEVLDANPGTATKPVYTIACGSEQEVFVDAIPTRIRVGNMQQNFYPESVTAIHGLVQAAAARVADVNLLTRISSYSTAVSSAQLLGAARDFLGTLDGASAALRYRQRLTRDVVLRAVLPEWLRDVVRSDIVREMANGSSVDDFTLSDTAVDQMLNARGIHPIWLLDGLAAGTHSAITYPLQGFGAQVPGVLNDWPAKVQWWLFPEGSFVLLDGGTLDVGVVRDSVLNATNDLEMFSEVFEGVAYRGVESLEIVSTVRPNGLSAGTKDTSTY